MYLIQILLAVFALFAILKIGFKLRHGELAPALAVGWIIFWILVIVVAILPNSTAVFAKFLGVGRGADLVVYLALALLFYLFFKISVRLEKIERNLTKAVRRETLDESSKETAN